MNKNFTGVIIAESLENMDILKEVKILSTKVEPVTNEHQTPWLKQWTLHTVEIPGYQASSVAEKISKSIDSEHNAWYADFGNKSKHYIIFREKIFLVDADSQEQYDKAKCYGLALGIPEYQVDFHPKVKKWERKRNILLDN